MHPFLFCTLLDPSQFPFTFASAALCFPAKMPFIHKSHYIVKTKHQSHLQNTIKTTKHKETKYKITKFDIHSSLIRSSSQY